MNRLITGGVPDPHRDRRGARPKVAMRSARPTIEDPRRGHARREVDGALAAALVVLLSLPLGPVSQRYGIWQRYIGVPR